MAVFLASYDTPSLPPGGLSVHPVGRPVFALLLLLGLHYGPR